LINVCAVGHRFPHIQVEVIVSSRQAGEGWCRVYIFEGDGVAPYVEDVFQCSETAISSTQPLNTPIVISPPSDAAVASSPPQTLTAQQAIGMSPTVFHIRMCLDKVSPVRGVNELRAPFCGASERESFARLATTTAVIGG